MNIYCKGERARLAGIGFVDKGIKECGRQPQGAAARVYLRLFPAINLLIKKSFDTSLRGLFKFALVYFDTCHIHVIGNTLVHLLPEFVEYSG